MENGVVEVLTAPQLQSRDVLRLKVKVALEEEHLKALETFNREYESAKKVIPAEEQDLRKGIAVHCLGQYEEAGEVLKASNHVMAKLFNVQSLVGLEQRTAARRLLPEMIQAAISSGDQIICIYATILACDLREVEEAKKALEKVNLAEAGAMGTLAQSCVDELEGRYQEALDGYESASQADHDLQGQAIFHLAKMQDRMGDDELAFETYKKLEELGLAFEEAMVNMGVILEDKYEFSRALAYYERALKINPKNHRATLFHEDAEACLNMHYDERKRKQDLKTNEILNIPISDFELSVRSRNCLSKMGIFTLKDLITKTEQELLSYKNFGETSLKEIRAMLAKKGLHLGMTRVEEQPLADRIKMNAQLYSQEKEYSLDELDQPIEDLDLSYRTKSALHKMGFESLRDITMRTGTDLESNPKFSAACLQEVNAMLEEKGLSYRPATSSGKPEGEAGDVLLGGEEEAAVVHPEDVDDD